jgi:DNA repair protein RadD
VYELRPYQAKAVEEIRSLFSSQTPNTVLVMPTGAGKTRVMVEVANIYAGLGQRVYIVVDGKSIVNQTSDRFKDLNIDHGVIMASDKRACADPLIQVCSIDTLARRALQGLTIDVLIIDEAHGCESPSYRTLIEAVNGYGKILAVTATPWPKDGFGWFISNEVRPISMQQLIAQGYLCPLKYYQPAVMDMSKVATSLGDYVEADSLKEFESKAIYGDVVRKYKELCLGELTFVYCINISHALTFKSLFEAAGVACELIDAKTSLEERNRILNSCDLVVSVGTLTTGVDVPRLKNMFICRPTQQKTLHVQMLGRGTRTYDGKLFCRVFDCVGNVRRHGFIVDETPATMEKPQKKPRNKNSDQYFAPIKTCVECQAICSASAGACKECGYVFEKPKYKTYLGDLVEMDDSPNARLRIRADEWFKEAWGSINLDQRHVWHGIMRDFGPKMFDENIGYYVKLQRTFKAWQADPSMAPRPKGWSNTYVKMNYHGDKPK